MDFIEKSTSADDLKVLLDILKERPHLKARIFGHVPDINPLNPKRNQPRFLGFRQTDAPLGQYGQNAPWYRYHGPCTGTPVHVSANGTVVRADRSDSGYGNQAVVRHRFGFSTVYAHLYTFIVKEGMALTKGDVIGFVGRTGKSTQNHIHYEIRKDEKPLAPYPFFTLGD